MSKKLQLSIPTPCHENWDDMNPVEKGRYCGSCQKQVVDFSNMSDRQVAEFFKKPSAGSVCGRFMTDQLDRDIQIPKKRIPWAKYFFQFAIPAFLVSMKSTAQGKVRVTETTKISETSKCTRTLGMISLPANIKKVGTSVIKGRVVDENRNPISHAPIRIKGARIGVPTNEKGEFSLNPGTISSSLSIVVSAVGFDDSEKIINRGSYSDTLEIVLSRLISTPHLVGEIVVVRKPEVKKELKNVPLIKEIFSDIPGKLFKAYPNPVKTGTSLHIEWKQNESGYYLVQLLNQSGQLTFAKEIWVDEETRLLELPLPFVSAGTYFLRMTHKQSGKRFTEKIIIQ